MAKAEDTNFQYIRVVDTDDKGVESVGYHSIPKTFINPAGVETKYPWPTSTEYFQVFAATEAEAREHAADLFGAPLDERKAAAQAALAALEAEEAATKKLGK